MSQRTDGGTRTYREGALAVAAPEACLVVRDAVGGEEVDEMDGLVTGLALVLRAGEIHGEQLCRGRRRQRIQQRQSRPAAIVIEDPLIQMRVRALSIGDYTEREGDLDRGMDAWEQR
jgi:hypothetical protein